MPPSLLITRPEPDAARFADAARTVLGADLRIVLSPVLRIERGTAPETGDAATLLLTSRHALFAAPRGMAACVVGPRLAELARDAGLDVRLMAPDAATLVPAMLADPPPVPLLHLRGTHVAAHLARTLSDAGLTTRETIVYSQVKQPLSADAHRLLAGEAPVIVPLFSPRSARLFFGQGPFPAPVIPVALSPAVAGTIPSDHAFPPIVAERPDAKAMCAVLPDAVDCAKRVEGQNRPQ